MAAAMKLLMLSALLVMGESVPAPEPDPHYGGKVLHYGANPLRVYSKNILSVNGGFPDYGEEDILYDDNEDTSPPQGSCKIDDISYPNGHILKKYDACLELRCIIGKWIVNRLIPGCGKCIFGGEPLVYLFDNLEPFTAKNPDNLISVVGSGEHRMADYDYVSATDTDFGVNGHFTNDPAGQCGVTGYSDCINGLIYYEEGVVAVKLTIYVHPETATFTPTSTIYVYTSTVSNKRWLPVPGWGLPKVIGDGKNVGTKSKPVLVFEGLSMIPGNPGYGTDCTIVIGSKGLTVGLCKNRPFHFAGFPWAFIYAMPDLQSPGTTTPLSGLCQKWTGGNQTCFTAADGSCTTAWQDGDTIDHETKEKDIRKLNDTLTGGFKVGG